VKLQASVPFREIIGQQTNPLRGASAAAKQCHPSGYGWVPKFPHRQSRAEKVALYRNKRAIGRITDDAWKAICADYPELKEAK
jgi:hypothetical protein